MLVLRCIKCGNVSGFDIGTTGSQSHTLKCPFCGYEDYITVWLGKSKDSKSSLGAEVLEEIRLLINDRARRLDLNGQFDVLSRRYNLSTLTLLRLVNIIASNENDNQLPTSRLNLHRYSRIEEKSVSGAALLEIVMNQLAVKDSEPKQCSSMACTHSNESVDALQENYSDLEKKYIQLKKDFEVLRMENERLNKEIEEYKKFWD